MGSYIGMLGRIRRCDLVVRSVSLGVSVAVSKAQVRPSVSCSLFHVDQDIKLLAPRPRLAVCHHTPCYDA